MPDLVEDHELSEKHSLTIAFPILLSVLKLGSLQTFLSFFYYKIINLKSILYFFTLSSFQSVHYYTYNNKYLLHNFIRYAHVIFFVNFLKIVCYNFPFCHTHTQKELQEMSEAVHVI